MNHVTSRDGTSIAWTRSGSGPPLVLSPGLTGHHKVWDAMLPTLEPHFSVYTFDRRGRGGSGDADSNTFDIAREADDLLALLDAIGEPAHLFGHSSGAINALEAALLTDHLLTLQLYEPPFRVDREQLPRDTYARVKALRDAGDREGVVELFLREEIGLMPAQIDEIRPTPAWERRVAIAHIFTREIRGVLDYVFEPARCATLQTPTLLILGGDSPPQFRPTIEALHSALPNSRVVVMPGQQHNAPATGPEQLTEVMLDFLATHQ
jgi:pimeloyl-ACP methyl ester carboxylesterase